MKSIGSVAAECRRVAQGSNDLVVVDTELGQPCVMMSGTASVCFERTYRKWMSSPSSLVGIDRNGSASPRIDASCIEYASIR